VGEAGGAEVTLASGRGLSTAQGRLVLSVLCLASFMAVVDDTIVTVALPSMRQDLGFSGADAQWIFNGYMLAFGGLLLLSGRAADLLLGLFVVAERRSRAPLVPLGAFRERAVVGPNAAIFLQSMVGLP
jgi:MFS family permease